ncbi:MAG: hypothetical protein ACM3SW_00520 [Actinomycetota bacterium]
MRVLKFPRLAQANCQDSTRKYNLKLVPFAAVVLVYLSATAQNRTILPAKNPSGVAATLTTSGNFDFNNPFFKSLGTNGRTCVTCHQPSEGWTVSAAGVQKRFRQSKGTDPIFRAVDGANCPNNATPGDAAAFSQLLTKGLIRIDRPLPANAEFSIEVTSDPYNCSTPTDISVYRRPLPTTNLKFLSAVMSDERETAAGKTISEDLVQQAIDATLGHAQAAAAPDAATADAIRDFEVNLFTAQVVDKRAGALFVDGANGGPIALSQQAFFMGINDPLGGNPSGAAFDPKIFNLFSAWADSRHGDEDRQRARAAIARGEQLFNTLVIPITGVGGLNDVLGEPVIMGTCGTCHDSPNAGDHSLSLLLNIGVTDASRRTPDQPLFTLINNSTGERVETTDPGRAMVSGRWKDISRFKGPILRGLAARAPYFHNGSAATLLDVINFYNDRFTLGLSEQQKSDLVAFLRSL